MSTLLTAASLGLGLSAHRSGAQLVLAESCTAGLAAHVIARTPGSSAWLLGGLVAYSNAFKQQHLGVRRQTLFRHGAVSAPTAAEMALGAVSLALSALHEAEEAPQQLLAVSITGIAGPDGARPGKPVGLVWFGLAQARCLAEGAGWSTPDVFTESRRFVGSRTEVQEATALHALALMASILRGRSAQERGR